MAYKEKETQGRKEEHKVSEVLRALYLMGMVSCSPGDPREKAAGLLEVLHQQFGMGRGVVSLVDRGRGKQTLLAARGLGEGGNGTPGARWRAGLEAAEKLSWNEGFVAVTPFGEEELTCERLSRERFPREDLHCICAPVPTGGEVGAVIAVDRLDAGDLAGELQLLSTVAALFSPVVAGQRFRSAERKISSCDALNNSTGRPEPLGDVLSSHVTSWVMKIEKTDSWKSDVFERLIGQVEKIVVMAALEKNGFVQTDTARFLGINRNTLARKIKAHGLRFTAGGEKS